MNVVEAIIELLFANIAFVILVAGGLYSFFKRLKETKNTAKPIPERRVNNQPKQTVSPFGMPSAPPEAKEAIDNAAPILSEKKYERSGNVRNERIANEKALYRYQDKEEAILSTFKVDQKELQKAIIWSEILSKPKALQRRS